MSKCRLRDPVRLRTCYVLLLSVGEAPDFIALDQRCFDVAHMLVMILGAGRTRVDQQLVDGVLDTSAIRLGSGFITRT